MLLLVVALPLAAALLLTLLAARAARPAGGNRDLAIGIALVAALAAAGALATLAPAVFAGQVPAVATPWLPWAGADLGLRLDGLALLFATLVTGIGALVILYARYYLDSDEPVARFLAVFMAFMAAMLGLVLADNLLLLAICWELTSVASFLLIGHWRDRADARRGARMALLITGLGGLALLAGVLLLGHIVGSFRLDAVLAAGDQIRAHPAYAPMLLLILLGVFTKSAQWPWHFWLPEAMAAPTPVSAYLHSATLVKAGIFLLARLHPALAGTDLWFWVVGGTGLTTLLVGAYLAVFQHDLKGLLAYSTISHLGLITLLFGLDDPRATVAAVFHTLNHATFKASLFMAAGAIDHETGSRDMRRLNGLWRHMPVTGVLAITATLAMAGVPLLNGFLSKEMFFAETLLLERQLVVQIAVPLLATLAGAFAVAYSARFVHDVFWNGEPRDLPRVPHDPPRWMLVPIGVLALLCVLVGLFPEAIIGPLLAAGAGAALGGPLPAYTLEIWHGFSLPLLMSAAATLLGLVFYVYLQRLFGLHDIVHLPKGGREIFDGLLAGSTRLAEALAGRLFSGRLRPSVLAFLLFALAAGAWPLLDGGLLPVVLPVGTPASLIEGVVWLLAAGASAVLVAKHRERVTALVLVGVIGLMVTLTFAGLSAPDLALTQLLVEVVSVILLLLALNFLPATGGRPDPSGRRWRDGVLAGAGGLGVAALAWAVMARPTRTMADWYLANAVPGAAGANAVNVIIVDFRALDTLGEIVVLAIAGLLVGSALAGWQATRADRAGSPTAGADGRAFLLELIAPLLLPLVLCVALFLFLRGHNLPGGGFVAGLLAATGLLLLYLARGSRWVEARWRASPQRLTGAGLLVAAGTGAVSLALAHPFLTSTYLAPVLPVLGKLPLASALFFDLGVLLTVAGATLLAVLALGRLGDAPAPPAEPRP
ncbi:MAG: monovalent cation/H+ antiporter subunit A [Chromatiales bacterium]|nr:monovalent cation/H+ antiporter subunit A [Chromatiales bacterium]